MTSKRYIKIILEFLIMIRSHYRDISNKVSFCLIKPGFACQLPKITVKCMNNANKRIYLYT